MAYHAALAYELYSAYCYIAHVAIALVYDVCSTIVRLMFTNHS